ncbi:uncharacterized protein [Montipora capricornis]|uniref:uncharacterized protein n=1 Tax=Montipora capricornis TaxID=246305 RepID=UPI0035F1A729
MKFTPSPPLAGRIVPSTTVQYRHREKRDDDAKDKLGSCSIDAHIRREGTSPATEEKKQEEPKEGQSEHENTQGEITQIEKNQEQKMKTDEFHETKPQVDNTQEERTQTAKGQDEKFQEEITQTEKQQEEKIKTYEFHGTKPHEERTQKDKGQDEKSQENNTEQDKREENKVTISLLSGTEGNYGTNPQDEANSVTVNADEFPDPTIWLSLRNICPDDPDATITLYKESKSNILDKTGWLYDSEIHAGQSLLKRDFPMVDGLDDPAVRGALVTPAASEFIQIINVGRHWVCLSNIGVTIFGAVRVFDSLYRKPNASAIEHACRMMHHMGDAVTLVNEKVQRLLDSSDCGLFALAFAANLCHGLDPTNRSYDQAKMQEHYISCLESRTITPFRTTTGRVPYHMDTTKITVPIFCECRLPNDKKEYVQCSQCCTCSWYHTNCVMVPEWAIKTKRKWQCQKCKNRRTLRLSNSLV